MQAAASWAYLPVACNLFESQQALFSHCLMTLGLNPQAAKLPTKDECDLAPYRRDLFEWPQRCEGNRPEKERYCDLAYLGLGRFPWPNPFQWHFSQQMFLNLPEVVLLELAPVAEEKGSGWSIEAYAPVVKDRRDEVKPRTSLVFGFVNEDREFGHRANPPIYKKCRGTTPGSWRPPLSRRQHLYSTGKDQSSRGVCFSDNSKIQISGIYGRSAA